MAATRGKSDIISDSPDSPDSKKLPEVAAVTHATNILKVIGTAGEPLGVNEIARRVGLHKSTVSRLLATLRRSGFVERDIPTGGFELGMEFVALAGPLLSDLNLIKAARSTLRQLASESGETVYIAVWNGQSTIMVEQEMGERAVAHYARPGTTMPTHASAAGKVFMACMPEVMQVELAKPLARYTEFTKTDPEDLRKELREMLHVGFCVNDQEYEIESCGIAAPVRDVRRDVVGALTIAVPKHRFEPLQQRNLAALIVRHASDLSRRLGYVAR